MRVIVIIRWPNGLVALNCIGNISHIKRLGYWWNTGLTVLIYQTVNLFEAIKLMLYYL